MKIDLPEEFKQTGFSKVMPIDMNDFDIEVFLPHFFFRVLAEGADAKKRPNKEDQLGAFLKAMVERPELDGFSDTEGERILARLVRASLVIMGKKGQSRTEERISGVAPLTLLSHKAGFVQRLRNVDSFLYRALLMASQSEVMARDNLRRRLEDAFGKGITIGRLADNLGGSYDGSTHLDTLTRLSITFLEGLQKTEVRGKGKDSEETEKLAAPALVQALGTDILEYMNTYCSRMPTEALAENLLALINFEMYIFTLKVVVAINALSLDHHILPPAMDAEFVASPPSIFVDFTGVPGGLSQTLSQACVKRDAEAFQRFLPTNLLLLYLDKHVGDLTERFPDQVKTVLGSETSGPLYLQKLLLLRDQPELADELRLIANYDRRTIIKEIVSKGDDSDIASQLDQVAEGAQEQIDKLIAIVAEGVRTKGQTLDHYIGWLKYTGGLNKPYGLLSGIAKGRMHWRYAPTNDLLAVLVQLAAIRSDGTAKRDEFGAIKPHAIGLRGFLDFLDERFGLAIDHPPEGFASTEHVKAGADNMRAMLSRLRQMGVFDDLSDDFSAQQLRPAYSED